MSAQILIGSNELEPRPTSQILVNTSPVGWILYHIASEAPSLYSHESPSILTELYCRRVRIESMKHRNR